MDPRILSEIEELVDADLNDPNEAGFMIGFEQA